jgi:nucleotide-binding universal stress UspA family protein
MVAVLHKIVVGVDGSDASKAAFAWAVHEARIRGDSLLAVLAWAPGVVAAGPWPGMVPVPVLDDDIEDEAKATLAAVVESVHHRVSEVEIEQRVVLGPPASALLAAARDAELLVVGSRGHGGFTGLLLGSVSQQCAQHAPCPVVIVRAPADG